VYCHRPSRSRLLQVPTTCTHPQTTTSSTLVHDWHDLNSIGSHSSMHLQVFRPLAPSSSCWILFLVFILSIIIMVTSCGALHCSWEKDTDFRGLDRHHSTCKYYQRESTLAAQKRQDRARESVEKSTQQPHRQAIITGSAAHNGVSHFS
jgi:hypothetical protein